MPGIELIRSLFQQASAQGSRSTALNPVGWVFATILSALIGSTMAKAPQWITVLLSVFAGLILFVYLFAYVYLMFRDRDALRSERFTLSKMAIERSITGDSLRGFSEVEFGEEKKGLPPSVEVPSPKELS